MAVLATVKLSNGDRVKTVNAGSEREAELRKAGWRDADAPKPISKSKPKPEPKAEAEPAPKPAEPKPKADPRSLR